VSVPAGTPANDEIARVAHAIWEAEGQPEGRDHEHWMRARQLIEEGRAEVEFPQGTAPRDGDPDAPPGTARVRGLRSRHGAGDQDEPGEELREEPGGRFAKQVADLPEQATEDRAGRPDIPGPRNPDPEPATNAEGYVAVPSSEEVAGAAIKDDPPPPEPQSKRGRARAPAAL
jgi:Protein of unknown function (DUF2934)